MALGRLRRRRRGAGRATPARPARCPRRPATAASWPTTPRRCARCRAPSPTTPRSRPTCSIPPAAATRSRSWPRTTGSGPTSTTPPAPTRCIICALAALQRERLVERGLDRLLLEVELPLVHVLREMEIVGVKLDCDLLARISERVQGEVLELEHEIYDLAGTEFHIGSPQQLGRGAVRAARPVAQAPRQDRLLDRRARAAGDPRRARDHPQARALPRADEARPDVPGRAPELCATRSRGCTPRSTRPSPPPGGCPRPTPTCRTFPSAPSSAARSGRHSLPTRAWC